ncbi:OmpP1/FadL family transporter [Alkalimarinus sediminis]|uniref:Outer membrane protein transport protein n=1 Tax=Alkalimarinus sediminis TaxID=1632866 RepID=A0A9E8HKI1_9ALTE|nr:outer membrane protein transport protein [Alkalimarinus sediminis]UZW74476.1 outer membrane protein transport protein [Alkalimarinus sediminis]
MNKNKKSEPLSNKKVGVTPAVLTLSALMVSSQLSAQGYYVDEQSAKRLGDAFSGGAAEAEDASTAFYNPAGLSRIKQSELVVNVSVLTTSTDVSATGTSLDQMTSLSSYTTVPLEGDGSPSVDNAFGLPSIYLAFPQYDQLAFGVSINAPYASGTEFNRDFVGRYFGLESEITGINVGFMASLKLTDQLSLGGGINMQRVSANLEQGINVAGYCSGAESLGLTGGNSCADIGVGAPGSYSSDGYFKVKGHDTDYGFTAGVLYEFSEDTRVGMNFRSKIEHTLQGSGNFTIPANAEAVLSALDPNLTTHATAATVELVTPETLSLSGFHQINERWYVQADANWTNWSRFKSIDIVLEDTGDVLSTPQSWNDSWRVALGGGFQLNPQWTLRAGLAFEKTPIPDQTTSIDFAFDDYKALSVGFSYEPSETLVVDAGLQHTLSFDRNVSQGDASIFGDAATTQAKVETQYTSLAVGLRWKFGE